MMRAPCFQETMQPATEIIESALMLSQYVHNKVSLNPSKTKSLRGERTVSSNLLLTCCLWFVLGDASLGPQEPHQNVQHRSSAHSLDLQSSNSSEQIIL